MYSLITHCLEKVMIPENRNFEEFMDFRDMIQGDASADRDWETFSIGLNFCCMLYNCVNIICP